MSKKSYTDRDHPFKTSACLRGGGGSPLLMFANARGAGVLGLPIAGMPMVADGRGVGVKYRENLPTS